MPALDPKGAFLYLIASLQRTNPIIYRAFLKLGAFILNLADEQAIDENIFLSHEIRLYIPGALATANNVLTTSYQIKFPRDDDNNLLVSEYDLTYASISAKSSPSAADCQVDILVSKNFETVGPGSATWQTIFGPTASQKLVLPQNKAWAKYSDHFSVGTILDGWFLRVDVIQDGTTSGAELILQGRYKIAS